MLSAMHIQRDSLAEIIERCRARGLRTVVGGPIASSLSADELKADHVVIGEAESIIADLARGLAQGAAKPVYQAAERPEMSSSPLPDLSLIKMRRYSTMAVQYSRGCPFNCEFCDIIEIYGRRPRTKSVAQVLAELDQLRAAGWREAVFIVDDNFIGNKARAKELCVALAEWRSRYKTSFDFNTEASLNMADDPELMQLMKDAGFVSVFLGIETPDLPSLIYQGITTIIGGNCGSSLAPLASPKNIETIQKWADLKKINLDWLTMKEFLMVLEDKKEDKRHLIWLEIFLKKD